MPENQLLLSFGIGSCISPADIFLAAFPIKKSGLVIKLETKITEGITITIIITLIKIILFLARSMLTYNDFIDSEVLIINGEPL